MSPSSILSFHQDAGSSSGSSGGHSQEQGKKVCLINHSSSN